MQPLDATLADRAEAGALSWRFSLLAEAVHEADLRRNEEHQIRTWNVLLPPRARRAVGHQADAVSVLVEFLQPRHQAHARAERRIHPAEAAPRRLEAACSDEVVGGDPRCDVATRACHIEIKPTPEPIEDAGRTVPFVGRADALFMQCHSSSSRSDHLKKGAASGETTPWTLRSLSGLKWCQFATAVRAAFVNSRILVTLCECLYQLRIRAF
jgi:hypothetical protein